MNRLWVIRVAAVIAVVFGAATIQSGGSVLFGGGASAAGNHVPFVVWFNFLAGFAYVLAGAGLWLGRQWAARVALALAIATPAVFGAFGAYIAAGGEFEMRTVAAMTLRSALWIAIASLACATFGCLNARAARRAAR